MAPHLVQNVQPPLLPAGHHIRRHAGAAERRRKRNLRTGKRRFHERLPSSPVAELRVIPAVPAIVLRLSAHPWFKHLRLRCRPHIETLQAALDSRPVFLVHRLDIVLPGPQHVQTALQAAPAGRWKTGSESAGLANHPAQFSGVRIEHRLVRQAHQKPAGAGVPRRAAIPHDAPSAQLQESRQHASGKMDPRGKLR